MSGVHLHLLVNHVPILGALFALALLVTAYWFGGDVLRRTALATLVGVAMFSAAAKFSGEPAEDAIRGMPGVTRAAIHEHEEAADRGFIAAVIVGLGAAFALYRWRRMPMPSSASMLALAGTVVVSGMMGYAGLLGGQVRHTEVRPGATAADALLVEPPRAPRVVPEGQ